MFKTTVTLWVSKLESSKAGTRSIPELLETDTLQAIPVSMYCTRTEWNSDMRARGDEREIPTFSG